MKSDFIGFSFQPVIDGERQTAIHSLDLNIYRVSDGSRYTENLFPTIKDKTAEIPGGDGMYFWSGNYTQRTININIAYDSLTETNKRKLQQVFDGRHQGYLIFDEAPYKEYFVKSTGTPNIKFICFENDGARIYKGEGTLSFVAYFPYAQSPVRGSEILKYSNQDFKMYLYGTGTDYEIVSDVTESTFNEYKKVYYIRNGYVVASITEEQFNSNKTNYYTVTYDPIFGPSYTQCTSSSVYDPGVQYYTISYVRCDDQTYSASETYYINTSDKVVRDNKSEWIDAAGLKSNSSSTYDQSGSSITVTNPGDLDADFILTISSAPASLSSISLSNNLGSLNFSSITLASNDVALGIDTSTHLIYGLKSSGNQYVRSGTLYKKYISSGDFFKIPCGSSNYTLTITGTSAAVDYKILYI